MRLASYRMKTLGLFLGLTVWGFCPIAAQNSGMFTASGSMGAARYVHTATRLHDGRVLVAGGNNGCGVILASAELYDPSTGTFSSTGSMATAREFYTATLLNNGKVLVTGGGVAGSAAPTTSAELYDPDTGMFSSTGSMATARGVHTATLLRDGRVLVTGGQTTGGIGGAGTNTDSAELYDPHTGAFSSTGSMGTSCRFHSATLLQDGRVLVAGGYGTSPLVPLQMRKMAPGDIPTRECGERYLCLRVKGRWERFCSKRAILFLPSIRSGENS